MYVDRVAEQLVITVLQTEAVQAWDLSVLRRVGDTADGALHLYQAGEDDAQRVVISHRQAKTIIETLAPQLDSKDMSWVIWRKIGLWTGGAIAALCLMIFVIIPSLAGLLAPLIPPEREAAVGRSVLGQIERFFTDGKDGAWICSSPEGDAALAKMTRTMLGDRTVPYDLVVQVTRVDMINAFALPGGQVVLMDGLIDAADTPEQVAGVLAHEIGHVHYRDPIEQALRAAGTGGLLSLVLGDVTGGALIGVVGEQMINSSYSRKAENRADAYALDLMDSANLNPEGFAEFFETLQAEMGDAADMETHLEWLSTHPASGGRADTARAAVDGTRQYDAILTDAEWAALQSICD